MYCIPSTPHRINKFFVVTPLGFTENPKFSGLYLTRFCQMTLELETLECSAMLYDFGT